MHLMSVVGARPNFVKIAPLFMEVAQRPDVFQQTLVHTGQHYDREMSEVFFQEFGLPEPHFNLGVGSGSHGRQTAKVMLELEALLEEQEPDWLVVVGDVNSTLAAALVASKMGIRTAHVEAGLRSFDRTMPEEVNRLLTDQIADLLLTPSRDGDENLAREGVPGDRIAFVGNVMIDTLERLRPRVEKRWPELRGAMGLEDGYVLVTLHRPSNVDHSDTLAEVLGALWQLGRERPVVFPIHPRTLRRIEEFGLTIPDGSDLRLIDPLGYIDFMSLTAHASLVLTDSGGVQEETTYLGVPCLTARPNTERPITIEQGTNRLVDSTMDAIVAAAGQVFEGGPYEPGRPELWDGSAAVRIIDEIERRG
jgi:UDP-N-acetylglucosamine 2-epimerase (non-hydrolysing)